MELCEALSLLQLPGGDAASSLTAEALRKQYLRLALRTHPDKNPADPGAAQRFQRLGAAHARVLEAVQHGRSLAAEQRRTASLLDLLRRALAGETVEEQLRELGEYRPPAAFGADLAVRFDGRVPPPPHGGSDGLQEPQPADLRQLFKEAFREEGLTDEGDPAGGYELPPDHECC